MLGYDIKLVSTVSTDLHLGPMGFARLQRPQVCPLAASVVVPAQQVAGQQLAGHQVAYFLHLQ